MADISLIVGEIDEDKIKGVFEKAENVYVECWEILNCQQKGKGAKKEIGRLMLTFQPKLAKILYQVEDVYIALCKEERNVIKRKSVIALSSFADRMSVLDRYKRLLNELMDIGKSLGDAFAWIFYQNEKNLLRKHFEHELIPHLPGGIGGKGELEFIKRIQLFGRYFVLAHSITTFLRHGDVSFIDPREMKVAAIGEIKTRIVNDSQIALSIFITGGQLLNKDMLPVRRPADARLHNAQVPQKMSPQMLDRLKRQIKSIKESFKPEIKSNAFSNIEIISGMEKLNELFKISSLKTWGQSKMGKGVVIVALKHHEPSLYLQLNGTFSDEYDTHFDRNMENTKKIIKEIINPGATDNNIRMEWLFFSSKQRYNLELGMRPVFWWPLKSELREALLFRRLRIMTLFNVHFIIHDLRASGLIVEINRNEGLVITKKNGENEMRLIGMHIFLGLIQREFFTEEAVLNMIHSIFSEMEQMGIKHSTTVNLVFDFKF